MVKKVDKVRRGGSTARKAAPAHEAPPAPPPARDVDTETRILDAAHAVFVRVGTAGARMQEIADEAGVNKALLHYYFRNKERLAAAVFERVAHSLFVQVGLAATAEVDLETKVRRIIGTYLDILARTPFAPAYILAEVNHRPERAAQLLAAVGGPPASNGPSLPFVATLAAQIEQRVAAGTMRPISPRQFLVNLASLCVFPFAGRPMICAVFGLDDAGFQQFIDERKATLADFFLASLRP